MTVPVVQALVLAERVYMDVSGKKIITGTFNKAVLRKPTKPIKSPDGKGNIVQGGIESGSPYAYISLVDVCDNTRLGIHFVSLKQNRVLFQTEIVVACKDRLATVELVAALPRLPIAEPGVYALEVVCEGEIIGSHRVTAVMGEDQGDSNASDS